MSQTNAETKAAPPWVRFARVKAKLAAIEHDVVGNSNVGYDYTSGHRVMTEVTRALSEADLVLVITELDESSEQLDRRQRAKVTLEGTLYDALTGEVMVRAVASHDGVNSPGKAKATASTVARKLLLTNMFGIGLGVDIDQEAADVATPAPAPRPAPAPAPAAPAAHRRMSAADVKDLDTYNEWVAQYADLEGEDRIDFDRAAARVRARLRLS